MKAVGRVLILLITLALTACSNRQAPAPLSVLDSQPVDLPTAFDGEKYNVRQGDTLFAIAWYSGNDYRDLAKWNGISAPYTIQVGQTVVLRAPKPQRSVVIDTDQTSTIIRQKRVESSKKQAYGESEKGVSHQAVRTKEPPVSGDFPARVSRWVWPANGQVIESFKQSGDVNKGIDIQAEKHSPVVSAAAGKVVYTGNALRGYGNLVIIKHTETFLSAYAHNDSILVKERQWVDAGQQIATVGSSGTTLVKLHFEVRYRGKSLDPMRYLPSQNNKK